MVTDLSTLSPGDVVLINAVTGAQNDNPKSLRYAIITSNNKSNLLYYDDIQYLTGDYKTLDIDISMRYEDQTKSNRDTILAVVGHIPTKNEIRNQYPEYFI